MAYVALINVHKSKLKELAEDGNTRARKALTLSEDATRLLASQEVTDLLLRFMIALIVTVVLVPPLHDGLISRDLVPAAADVIAYGGVLLLAALFTLIFGELLPSTIALRLADKIALYAVTPIRLLSTILAPILQLSQWISSQIATPFVGKSDITYVTEEEIKMMVDAGSEGGAIEDEEKEMIYSVSYTHLTLPTNREV